MPGLIAKDGADMPPVQATMRRAHTEMGPGETADFELRPLRPGRMVLDVRSVESGWHIPLEVIVEAAPRRAPPRPR